MAKRKSSDGKSKYAHLSDGERRRIRADLQLKTFANLVAKDLQRAIRMESADRNGLAACFTCDKVEHFTKMDACHFVQGRSLSTLFLEDGIRPGCVECNRHKLGNQAVYQTRLEEQIGVARVAELKALKNVPHTLDHFKLADLREGYKARIKVQKLRLGIK